MNTNTAYENLAKLMSTENIGVTYGNVETAYFNVATRTLMVPNWEGLSEIETALLIAHEIGHALYTPPDSWKSAIDEMGLNFKGYLNIVEDARIEKAVKTKFPGTKQIFYYGYQKFSERENIFPSDLSLYTFVDIINAHYKLMGPILGIKLNEAHQYFIDKIDNIVTFDDAVSVAKEIYYYSKESKSNKSSSDSDESTSEQEGTSEQERKEGTSEQERKEGTSEQERKEGTSERTNDNTEESNKNLAEETKSNNKENNQLNEAPESITSDSIEDSLRSNLPNSKIYVADIPDPILKNIIIPYKELMSSVNGQVTPVPSDKENGDHELDDESEYDLLSTGELDGLLEKTSLNSFMKSNASKIAYHKQLFEMRKKALEHKRTLTFRSGMLNMNKIHEYKYNDQIFNTFQVKESGKKHGLIFFLDMSGSMASYISGAISKLLEIVLFCKSSGIPFVVYGFTSSCTNYDLPKYENYGQMEYKMELSNDFHLIEFLTSDMSNVDFKKCVDILLERVGGRRNSYGILGLGGTPLNETILCLSSIVKNFRNNTNAKIVNCVFFTDGEGHAFWFEKNTNEPKISKSIFNAKNEKFVLYDSKRKKNYTIEANNNSDLSKVLLEVMKNRIPGTNIVNYHIVSSLFHLITDNEIQENYPNSPKKTKKEYDWRERDSIDNNIRKNPIILIRNNHKGFDQAYYLTSNSLLNHKQKTDAGGFINTTALRDNFILSSKNKKEMNKLISAFVDMIV